MIRPPDSRHEPRKLNTAAPQGRRVFCVRSSGTAKTTERENEQGFSAASGQLHRRHHRDGRAGDNVTVQGAPAPAGWKSAGRPLPTIDAEPRHDAPRASTIV